jgi:predicted nucleotidyltransferase
MRRPAKTLPSGRFLLRIDAGLHAALRAAARAAGVSLNDYCVRKLAVPSGDPSALRAPADLIARAAAVVGEGLLGVVAYGSFVRGEAASTSDVDALIVVDASVSLTRALYRRWDEVPLTWNGRTVDPHFVHLPSADERSSGLWAEVAVDGIVLFERGLCVSEHLVRIRRDILHGRLVRRFVHGQPYWAEAS